MVAGGSVTDAALESGYSSVSAYIAAFTQAELRVVACHEPALTAEHAQDEAKAGLEEAFELALTGFPVVIVWDLLAC